MNDKTFFPNFGYALCFVVVVVVVVVVQSELNSVQFHICYISPYIVLYFYCRPISRKYLFIKKQTAATNFSIYYSGFLFNGYS